MWPPVTQDCNSTLIPQAAQAVCVLQLLAPHPPGLGGRSRNCSRPHDLGENWLPISLSRTPGNGARLPWWKGGQEGAVSNWPRQPASSMAQEDCQMRLQLRLLLWLCADLCPCFAQEQSSVHNMCMRFWAWIVCHSWKMCVNEPVRV